jgi:hypothetical protein
MAVEITVAYSDAEDDQPTEVRVMGRGEDRTVRVRKVAKEGFKKYMI